MGKLTHRWLLAGLGLVAAVILIAALPATAASDAVHLHLPKQSRAERLAMAAKSRDKDTGPKLWVARCTSPGRTDVPVCSVEQRVVLKQSGRLLAALTVVLRPGSNTPTLTAQLPLGLALQKGLILRIDRDRPLHLPIETCDESGCYASTEMSRALLKAMEKGDRVQLRFVAANGKPITVPMPLTGFAKAYKRID